MDWVMEWNLRGADRPRLRQQMSRAESLMVWICQIRSFDRSA